MVSSIRWNTVFPFLSQHLRERLSDTTLHCRVSPHLWVLFHVWDHRHTHKACNVGLLNEWVCISPYYPNTYVRAHRGERGEHGDGSQCGSSWGSSQRGENYSFPPGCWGPGDSGGISLPWGWHSFWGESYTGLMPNPWSAKQASIITSFLSGKYDLLFKDLIYGLVFRSTRRQEAVHPILPILFQALNNNSESFHLLFPNEISYSLCPTPNPALYDIR